MKDPAHDLSCSVLVAALVLISATPLTAQSTTETEWSLAATGDSIITRRIAIYDDPAFMSVVKVIRDADVAFTNLEMSLFRLWELGPPEAAEDLKWMGIDLFNRANNHTTDYGVEGMVETNQGRIALIGLATTFTPMSRAGETRPNISGRPGLNALRVNHTFELDSDRMSEWRQIIESLGGDLPDAEDEPVRFGRIAFAPGTESKVISEVNPRDEERILRSIGSAARQADFVIVNSHSHDPNIQLGELRLPARDHRTDAR